MFGRIRPSANKSVERGTEIEENSVQKDSLGDWYARWHSFEAGNRCGG